jgi:hypothetical protein
MSIRAKLLTACAAVALTAPAAALAHPGQAPNSSHNPVVTYVFKGTVASSCTGQDSGSGVGLDRLGSSSTQTLVCVLVNHGNAFVSRGGFVGTTVQFDLAGAKVTVADHNQDGMRDVNDVMVGDRVLVQAPLHQLGSGPQPFTARHLVDQTH